MQSKGLWALLETYPFPEDVRHAGVPAVTALLAKSHKEKEPGPGRKQNRSTKAAQKARGSRPSVKADRVRLTMYLEEIKRSDARRKLLEREIKDLLKEIPLAEYILSLPGMGPVSCGIFLGELGNPGHFKNPRQIIKYAGYDPKENDSGSRVGRKIISKKGRWLLRKCLYFMVLRVVHGSSFFKEYYEHKKKGLVGLLQKRRRSAQ